jgi:hypothetical protein
MRSAFPPLKLCGLRIPDHTRCGGERRGFGSTVIASMVKRTVDGDVELDYAPSGLMWRLTTGLKDDGVRSGDFADTAIAVGAVVYDFLGHRLNEIYPDKSLAQAALRASDRRPSIFAEWPHGRISLHRHS